MKKYFLRFVIFLAVVFVLAFGMQIAKAADVSDVLSQQIGRGAVDAIQKFLNSHGFLVATIGPGSAGNETNIMGRATKKALCRYQVNVLKLSPTSIYCGQAGPWTLKRIHEELQKSTADPDTALPPPPLKDNALLQALLTTPGDPLADGFGDILPPAQQFVTIPMPQIDSLFPDSATVGGSSFILTITGSNFGSAGLSFNSIVTSNGMDRTTTYVSPNKIRAIIPTADIATSGILNIKVYNPTSDPERPLVSDSLTFTVNEKPVKAPATKSSTSGLKDLFKQMASISTAFSTLLEIFKK